MNRWNYKYKEYRGRVGFLGIFGPKFRRNKNYRFYDNVYITGKPLFLKGFEAPKKIWSSVKGFFEGFKKPSLPAPAPVPNALVASVLSMVIVLNSYMGEIQSKPKADDSYYSSRSQYIDELYSMKSVLQSVTYNNYDGEEYSLSLRK